jgi:hypothetical protein
MERKCYAARLDPTYCAMVIDRLATLNQPMLRARTHEPLKWNVDSTVVLK